MGTLDTLRGAGQRWLQVRRTAAGPPQPQSAVGKPAVAQPRAESIDANPPLQRVFLSFLRLGLTAFGGPAMIPYIRRLAVEQKRWIDQGSFRDGVALCQTIPGATAMQMSAYVGLRARGIAGAALAFVGFGLPAFLLMTVLSALYVRTHDLPAVMSAFAGLQAVIVAVVANATVMFGRTSLKGWKDAAIGLAAAIAFLLGINPILTILLAAPVGVLLYGGEPLARKVAGMAQVQDHTRSVLLLLGAVALAFAVLFVVQPTLFDLAALMARIDLFAFGGGFTSVPLMYHEVVDVRHWLDGPTFLNGIAMGQVTPGPIVITATFVGYLLYGPLGALVGTISVFLPSFLIVVGVGPYFARLSGSPYFNRAIRGVSVSFVGLLLSVTVNFAMGVPWDLPRLVLAGAALAALLLRVEILWVVLAATIISAFVL
ncbi:MAG: chromate efflux transporter [Chloroflexota bacterium]